MRIKQISVSGLFGIFDHVIPLNMNERITIIHGPNGFGKTVMLRILNGFFNSRYSELQTIPFSKFCVEFDDASADELAKLMQDKFKEYGTISQSLDRTFPVRVVKQQVSPDLTDEQLRDQLNKLEATRSRLIEVGLLDKDEDSEFQIQPQDIDESTKNALSVYVEDVGKKLSVFTEIATKIDLFSNFLISRRKFR